jgi:hypothetical protein
MDFEVYSLCFLLDWLKEEEQAPDYRLAPPPAAPEPKARSDMGGMSLADLAPAGLFGLGASALGRNISEHTQKNTKVVLGLAKRVAMQIELDSSLDRIKRFESRLERAVSCDEYRNEARTLRESIEDGIKKRSFLYIQNDRAKLVESMAIDWQKTIIAFKTTAKHEIGFAIRCYITGNPTACVFHLMRAAEIGLRALATERRVTLAKNRPLAWADWQELLDGINKKVRTIASKRRGPAREKALVFYQGILGEFEAFKDVYRNNVMHSRETYDMPRALSVLNHVREFMERLSDKIAEDTTKQIKWGLR